MKYGQLSCTELQFLSSTTMPLNWLIHLLDTWLWLEGSYELGSVYPFTRKFSWNWIISFLKYLRMVLRGSCGAVHDRAGFFENDIFATKMDQK